MKLIITILLFANISLTYSQLHPDEYENISSTEQAFYMFTEVFLNDELIENNDWVVAFNGDVCVGSYQWDTSACGQGICSMVTLGDDGETYAEGYLNQGDIPTFKIYDTSEDTYYDAISSENIPWENGQIYLIDKLEGYYYDCEGTFGGSAIIDDCGICSMGFTGHVPNSDKDCFGTCFGEAIMDECDICDGDGANIMCWDDSFVCNVDDCPFNPLLCPGNTTYLNDYLGNNDAQGAQKCIPNLFLNDENSINSSTKQAFYTFHIVTLNGEFIDDADWVAAFNGDVCVGAKLWDTSNCNNEVCNVPAMGYDSNDEIGTQGYCEVGDVPTFKIYDISEDTYYDAIPSENIPWVSLSNYDIDILSFCNLAMDCAGECGGMAEIDECGICNGNGIIDGTCDCDGNVLDCSGVCGGDAVMDECEICDGPGEIYECGCNELSEGTCDCDGNILDCSGICGGNAAIDECGVCGG